MERYRHIHIISDATGRTARRLMDAVLVQYNKTDIPLPEIRVHQQVRTRKVLAEIIKQLNERCLVIYSIVSRDLAGYCHRTLRSREILHLDILDPMLSTMAKFLGFDPDYEPGLLQVIDDRYYRKVDAIGYAVEHDDGLGGMIENADVILLGVSRTCKTPISMYLACNHGLKVANIPIVPSPGAERQLLQRLQNVRQEIILGLLMRPDILSLVREERSYMMAQRSMPQIELEKYYDERAVREEVKFCRQLFARCGWRTVDVTRRAIEEISTEIIKLLGLGRVA